MTKLRGSRAGTDEASSNPRVVDQATLEVDAEGGGDAPSPAPSLSVPTETGPRAPRSAAQSTREVLLEDGKPMRLSNRPEMARAHADDIAAGAITPLPSSPARPERAAEPLETTDEMAIVADDVPWSGPRAGAGETWPPAIADYTAGSAETVEEPRGLSARDLADLDLQPTDVEERAADEPELPGPWASDWRENDPPGALRAERLDRPERPLPTSSVSTAPEAIVMSPSALVTGSIEPPAEAPPVPRKPRAGAKTDNVRASSRKKESSTTDHVQVKLGRSSPKVIFIAGAAATIVLGTVLVAVLWSRISGTGGPATATGSLLVRTVPEAGCTVFVDETPTGLLAPGSSLLISDLTSASYKVSVRCIGFEQHDETVAVRAGEVALLKAALRPE